MADHPDVRLSGEHEWTSFEQDVFLLAERTDLLLACLRNYRALGFEFDLKGALALEPELRSLLNTVHYHFDRRL